MSSAEMEYDAAKSNRAMQYKPKRNCCQESPTIQNLIEQLNRDLEETQRNDF